MQLSPLNYFFIGERELENPNDDVRKFANFVNKTQWSSKVGMGMCCYYSIFKWPLFNVIFGIYIWAKFRFLKISNKLPFFFSPNT